MAPLSLVTRNFGFILHRARLHRSWLDAPSARHDADGFGLYDLEVIDRRVASITPAVANGAHVENDLRGRIVSPCFVDCHTHLDKGHIWHRRSNPDGTFAGALEAVAADRTANWTAEDVATRMQFGLKCAHAHGTRAIRTHIDSDGPQDAISWPVFERLRAEWSGRIELQGACLQSIEKFREPGRLDALADRVAGAGGVLGAVAYMVPDIDELLDAVFAAAMKRGLALDFHADETGEADARALHHIALAAIRHGYRDRILIGHCCSLARQPEAHVLETLDLVARSGIDVVTLPLCNLFLQDRRTGPTTPRWRGVTLVHEMAERGINVCAASDNTRDPFYAYGDLDMLEVYRMATRICHFDHPVGDWPRAVFANPARAMGLDPVHGRIAAGEPADLIIFAGRSWTELLSRPEPDRVVVREGTVIDRALPAYEELDHLME